MRQVLHVAVNGFHLDRSLSVTVAIFLNIKLLTLHTWYTSTTADSAGSQQNNNNNNNNNDDIYSAVIVAELLREFTRFTR